LLIFGRRSKKIGTEMSENFPENKESRADIQKVR
jgi:hypothetical protein